MLSLSKLFKRQKGGTAVGRIWRNIANRLTSGVAHDIGLINIGDDINKNMD